MMSTQSVSNHRLPTCTNRICRLSQRCTHCAPYMGASTEHGDLTTTSNIHSVPVVQPRASHFIPSAHLPTHLACVRDLHSRSYVCLEEQHLYKSRRNQQSFTGWDPARQFSTDPIGSTFEHDRRRLPTGYCLQHLCNISDCRMSQLSCVTLFILLSTSYRVMSHRLTAPPKVWRETIPTSVTITCPIATAQYWSYFESWVNYLDNLERGAAATKPSPTMWDTTNTREYITATCPADLGKIVSCLPMYAVPTIASSPTTSAAIAAEQQCCFELKASGGVSATMGQLSDGQNRIGGDYKPVTYCIKNGGITDSFDRGCHIVPANAQFQCDAYTETSGFSISNGQLEYSSNSTFFACLAAGAEYNVYTEPIPGQGECVKINSGGTAVAATSTGAVSKGRGVTSTIIVKQPVSQKTVDTRTTVATDPPGSTIYSTRVVPPTTLVGGNGHTL